MNRALALVVAAGCGAAVPPVPSQGGPAWTELASEHFTLWTDAPAARGRELIAQLEHLHQIVYGVAFPTYSGAGTSFVIALRDRYEVEAFVPAMFAAYAIPEQNAAQEPMIVIDAQTDDRDGHVLAHELTHVISRGAIRDQPVWFAEGIAQFFETTSLDAKRAVVDVGEPLPKMLHQMRTLSLVPGDQLFACTRRMSTCRDARFYMTSAVLYAYLANERPQELERLQHALAAGDPNAWATALPELPPAALDQALRAWLVAGRHRVWHFRVALRTVAIAQRTLGDGDVWAARALLHTTYYRAELAADVQRALAADPTNVLARLLDADLGHRVGTAEAHATAAAHPDDWRAWLLVLRAGTAAAESAAVRSTLCGLAARNPAAFVSPALCREPR